VTSIGLAATFRILDANLNRAREGLRVMEEYARFVLNDPELTAALKELRHELVRAIPPKLQENLPVWRDVAGDVGTSLTAPREFDRTDAADVVAAAAARLGESLRVIEEYGKTLDRAFAEKIEQIRYRAYETERRLLLCHRRAGGFGGVQLYVIITEAICRWDWMKTAEEALRGGADAVQFREKKLPDRELLRRAQHLAKLCRSRQAVFIVNDRPDVAALVNADGVHLGQDDLPVREARRIMPEGKLIGVSTHTIEQVTAAAAEVPDYIAVGPMYPSSTKPQQPTAGLTTLAAARHVTSLPLVAIGGIDAENARAVLEAGARALCVGAGIVGQPDVAEATAKIRAVIDSTRGPAAPYGSSART
jgi:thiamine-phosphate pyrophosphorylase